MGNYLTAHGAYEEAAAGVRTVLPSVVFHVLVIGSIVAGVLLAGQVTEFWRRTDRLWLYFGLLLAGGIIVLPFLGQTARDRYLLPLLLPASLVAARRSVRSGMAQDGRRTERLRVVAAVTAVGAIWFVALSLTLNALAFDAARWRAAEHLVATGVSATDIDAGLEWDGYRAATVASWAVPKRAGATWTINLFQGSRECYLVSAAPRSDGALLWMETYRTYAVAGSSYLWIYRMDPCL